MQSRNARIGMMLFVIYLLLYSGFVLINTFNPQLMEKTPFAGVNLAIWYGMALIIGAFVMAMIYGFICTPEGDEPSDGGEK